ncbi:MAG: molybdopterin converting factor subunit 1 [Neomegalonema sp.]|nr:molybdopterin converting factor subunit 1 [Neomegalonema sp.]
MRVLYFAWLRERIGVAHETVSPPDYVKTAADLTDWLMSQEPRYQAAFADLAALRVAIDQEQADLDSPITGASEVAFFPPVTGG